MKKPSSILLVTFESSLTFSEVAQIVTRRKKDFKAQRFTTEILSSGSRHDEICRFVPMGC